MISPSSLQRLSISCIAVFCLAGPLYAAETLNAAIILDSNSYAPTHLFEIYKGQLGRAVTAQTATLIAKAVQQKYADDGYTMPGYQILDTGEHSQIIRIRLVEASVSGVDFSGEAGPHEQKLQKIFGDLPSDGALRPEQVREALRRARQLPGLSISASTEPDKSRNGAFVLKLETGFKPIEGSIKLSNRGTKEIGRSLLLAGVAANGLFGLENTSGIFGATAKNSSVYRSIGAHTRGSWGNHGASAQIQGSRTSVNIESNGIQLAQRRDLYQLTLNRPIERWPAVDATVWSVFESDNLDVIQDGTPTREDRLRSIEFGITTIWRGSTALTQLKFGAERSVGGFGSEMGNLSGFTIAQLHYLATAQLGDTWTVRWDNYGQYSAQALPAIKRFKVGGNRIGRGFEAAAVSGDRGIGTKIELQRRLTDASGPLSVGAVYGYYDLGAAWTHNLGGRESAASGGIGFAMRGEQFSGYLELAKPLTHVDADGTKDAGLFAELSFQF